MIRNSKIRTLFLFISVVLIGFIVYQNNLELVEGKEYIQNPYFFKGNISKQEYNATFMFDDIDKRKEIVKINRIVNLKNGALFKLSLNAGYSVPNERKNLGYFYVQSDKIYKIDPTKKNLGYLKKNNKVPPNSVIVCQKVALKDKLGSQKGFHQYIKIKGDKCEFHSWNDKVESGFFEDFTWEKDKGLIEYKSGFGAEADSIELTR
jgi:hypothetical protein